jgi:hypothetical protein
MLNKTKWNEIRETQQNRWFNFCNQNVGGSNPFTGSIIFNSLEALNRCLFSYPT